MNHRHSIWRCSKGLENAFQTFHSKNVNKMNDLKGEFVRSTLPNAETNPDERFSELFFIRRRLEVCDKSTTLKTFCLSNAVNSDYGSVEKRSCKVLEGQHLGL
jgi:hypothetical protein